MGGFVVILSGTLSTQSLKVNFPMLQPIAPHTYIYIYIKQT